jgi:hypothetical protein
MQLIEQPRQHASILIPDNNVAYIRTAMLKDFHIADRLLEEFKQECFESAGCYKAPEEVECEIATLERNLLAPPPITINTSAAKDTGPAASPSSFDDDEVPPDEL